MNTEVLVGQQGPEAPAQQPSRLHRIARAIAHAGSFFAPEVTVWGQEDANYQAVRERYETWEQTSEMGTAVRAMHERGFGYKMPKFANQCADKSRRTLFLSRDKRIMTEHEGLQELHGYLEGASAADSHAGEILEGLNFMGKPEFTTAAMLAAQFLKSTLLRNPKQQICLATPVSHVCKEVKSDQYALNAILSNFSEDELVAFKDQLVFNPEHLTVPPELSRIFILDDWLITGVQMPKIIKNWGFMRRHPEYIASTEMLVFVAPPQYAAKGMRLYDPSRSRPGITLPVTACYQAYTAPHRVNHVEGISFITGLHATADYPLGDPDSYHRMRYRRGNIPGLMQVVRLYTQKPLAHLERAKATVSRGRARL